MHLPFLRAQHGLFCGCIHLYAARRRERIVRNLFAFLTTSKAASKEAQKASSAGCIFHSYEHNVAFSVDAYIYAAAPFPAQRRKCAEPIRFSGYIKSCIKRSPKASSAAKSLAVRDIRKWALKERNVGTYSLFRLHQKLHQKKPKRPSSAAKSLAVREHKEMCFQMKEMCGTYSLFWLHQKAASKEAQKASSAAKSLAVREHKEMGSQMVFHFMTVPFFFLPARKFDPPRA
ncbi:hypothetical protein CEXT_68471 [Caerostris extrusa]|uniref:Uncharacterized protein n=1 Tax=Caerostris extrusa TaxID=172846 RepID=A0AAV4QI38_CAEEX|nr:hypothetical protein CEXT_68471 [Caerostris extrusa]